MAKVNVKELIELLQNAGASAEDIPKLVMTAYYESNFDTLAENETTNALGLFQINASSFYDGEDPDNTLSSFFKGNNLKVEEFEKKLEDPQYNANFAVHYLNVIKKDLEDGVSQFTMVKENDNDPFAVWEAYTDYVKPYLEGKKIEGRGPDEVAKRNDVTIGVGTYLDAYTQVYDLERNKQIQENIANIEPERDPVTIYDAQGNPVLVDAKIVSDLIRLEPPKYFDRPPQSTDPLNNVEDLLEAKPKTPVSVEEGQKEKEVKDVLTAHIYSYLQKQKNVYESQVPKEAGPIDVARVKTDIRRKEVE
jgi:hypothetical protein